MDKTLSDIFKLDLVNGSLYKLKMFSLIWFYNIYFRINIKKYNFIFFNEKQFRKRFCAGAYLGYTISTFIQKDDKNISLKKKFNNGIIYGYWGISIILLDHLQDNLLNDQKKIRLLYNQCLLILSSGFNVEYGKQWITEPNNIIEAVNTVHNLFTLLNFFISELKISTKKFCLDSEELLQGQFNSMAQKVYASENDFNWYYSSILNQKTLNFYLAPFSLYGYTEKGIQNSMKLEEVFHKLNLCYFHWQGIDDIADLEKDIKDSIISMPGYILISQGILSEKIIKYSGDSDYDRILKTHLEESKLMIEPFSTIKIYNDDSNSMSDNTELNYNLKIAISNSKSDFQMDIFDLAKGKITIKDNFIKAYLEKDFEKILTCVKLSKSCERIINATQNTTYINFLRKSLLNESLKLKLTMKCINHIILNCYNKALRMISTQKSLD